jgi:hypothetical protein
MLVNPFGTRVSYMRRKQSHSKLIFFIFCYFFWPLFGYLCCGRIEETILETFLSKRLIISWKKCIKSENWIFLKGKLGSLCRMVRVAKGLAISFVKRFFKTFWQLSVFLRNWLDTFFVTIDSFFKNKKSFQKWIKASYRGRTIKSHMAYKSHSAAFCIIS